MIHRIFCAENKCFRGVSLARILTQHLILHPNTLHRKASKIAQSLAQLLGAKDFERISSKIRAKNHLLF